LCSILYWPSFCNFALHQSDRSVPVIFALLICLLINYLSLLHQIATLPCWCSS
jgi:hypothetical protein